MTASKPTKFTHPGPDHKPPRPNICGGCHAPVWYALIEGGAVNLDPTPVDLIAEIHARLQGRATVQDGPGHTLLWRTVDRIRRGTPRFVLAEHRCTPAPHPPLTALWPERPRPAATDEPEF